MIKSDKNEEMMKMEKWWRERWWLKVIKWKDDENGKMMKIYLDDGKERLWKEVEDEGIIKSDKMNRWWKGKDQPTNSM